MSQRSGLPLDDAGLQTRRPQRGDGPPPSETLRAPGPGAPGPTPVRDVPPESGPVRAPPIDENVLRQFATINPLLGAAIPLLTLVCQVRGTLRNEDVPRLQFMVSEELKSFETRALLAESSPQDVVAARYVLCSLIDETVLSTPWGAQSPWAAQTMLSIFHKETWGGEKVFVILERIKSKPSRYLHLLELIDMCLTLGFRGRYEILENGLFQLEDLRNEIWHIVREQRGLVARPLAPELRAERVRRSLVRYVPLWVVFAIAAFLAVMLYGGLRYALDRKIAVTESVLDHVDPRP